MGAEGVYLGAIADREIGFALKCEDGSLRGQEALVVELLEQLVRKTWSIVYHGLPTNL